VTWYGIRPWLGTVARLVLGAVFIWASIAKLRDPLKFVQAVRAYQATPEWLSKGIGYGLPVLELCVGVALVLGVSTRIAAGVSALLLMVFLVGLIQAAARGLQLACGCFGGGGVTAGHTTYTLDILRDVGLLVLAVFLVLWPLTRLSVDGFLARHDEVPVPSAKRMRTPEGRRRYEAALAVSQTRARSRHLYLDSALGIVVILVTIIGIGVQAGRAKITGQTTANNASPALGVISGSKAPATVDLYEDFGCPNCLNFEKATHALLEKDVAAGKAQLRYHPIAILDASSPNQYSTRAANAAICVSDVSVAQFVKFHDLLYGTYKGKQVQPAEGTAGPSDTSLETYAQKAGVPSKALSTLASCVESGKYDPFVTKATDLASQHKINATPTVRVNGKTVSATPAAVQKAIDAAVAAEPPDPEASEAPASSSSAPASSSGSASVSPSSSPKPSSSAG
jgi:protein-disulfide isomerase